MLVIAVLLLQGEPSDPLVPARLILALLCVVVASSVGLAVTVGLARRIREIGDAGEAGQAGPDDD